MLEQLLLATVTSAGSATLAWYLCTQYMGTEIRKREERLRTRQRKAERQVASLKAKLEARILYARLEEARGLAVLLAGQLQGMVSDGAVTAESPMALTTLDPKAGREPSRRGKAAALMTAPKRETVEVCGRGEGMLRSNAQ
jgi:hypothetical protein